jgi:hypothetical protein
MSGRPDIQDEATSLATGRELWATKACPSTRPRAMISTRDRSIPDGDGTSRWRERDGDDQDVKSFVLEVV